MRDVIKDQFIGVAGLFEQLPYPFCISGEPLRTGDPRRQLVIDCHQTFGHVDGFQVGQRVVFIQLANDIGQVGKQPTRHLRKIHPPQLDVGGVAGQVVRVQVGHARLKDALTIEGKIATLGENERHGQDRQ